MALLLFLCLFIFIYRSDESQKTAKDKILNVFTDADSDHDVTNVEQRKSVIMATANRSNHVSLNGTRLQAEQTTMVGEGQKVQGGSRTRIHEETCDEEVKHLYFLKVHKAGSTTMMNIFSRFAMTRELNVMTPMPKLNNIMPQLKTLHGGKFDVMCEHSIYGDSNVMSKLHTDTTNISIVREPMSHLRSYFNFKHFDRLTRLQKERDPVAKFLKNPRYYVSRYGTALQTLTKNFFAHEFGYKSSDEPPETYLSYLESKFLVLIFERLPESMIILKRKLCWRMKDVMYAHFKKKQYHKLKTNHTLVNLHKSWNPLDYLYYQHFYHVFESMTAKQGDNFQQEVALFERYLQRTRDFCSDVYSHLGPLVASRASRVLLKPVLFKYEYFEASPWEPAFNVSGVDCIMMAISPIQYRKAERVHLFPQNCKTKGNVSIDDTFCGDYFAYKLPWDMLFEPHIFAGF